MSGAGAIRGHVIRARRCAPERSAAGRADTADERAVLERAIARITEQAADVHAIVDEAVDAGLDGSEPFVSTSSVFARSSCP